MKSYADNIKPYHICSHEIWEINDEKKKNCLKLDWNEATVPPSPKVFARLKQLAGRADFYQWYPDTDNRKLITLISEYMNVGKDNVQIFASSDTLQEYIVRCWLRAGDKVLILWPTYDNFRATAEIAGAEIIYSQTVNLKFDIKQFQKDINIHRPQMVYICNPNNPTGEQIDKHVIEQMIQTNSTVLFLIDEAYAEFSNQTVSELVEVYENLLISRTFSKAFALANFRIGYLISSVKNVSLISRIRNAKNITTYSQEAAITALEDIEYMKRYVSNVKKARQFFQDEAVKFSDILKVYPSETNFVLIKLKSMKMKQDFLRFMKVNNIYIRDLQQDVLAELFVRITVGTIDQMKIVVKKIIKFRTLLYEGGNF